MSPASLPGLYIHIPFCLSKCPYCDFGSTAGPPPSLLAAYLDALHKQAETCAKKPQVQEICFGSLFIGGGTPTVYDGRQLAAFVLSCQGLFSFDEDAEISIEANPNSVSLEKLEMIRGAGVNRLSIGVQSFDDGELKKIGRSHTADEALTALALARQAGFENVNIDLMYGLPEQDTESWECSVRVALTCAPEHLALYELTIEEKTSFARLFTRGKLFLPHEETVLHMEEIARNLLEDQGVERYEISNYARRGQTCAHNINYWKNGTYLGLGAGAVSFLGNERVKNIPSPEEYAAAVNDQVEPVYEKEMLSKDARFRETVVMGLRMLDGVSEHELSERFGISLSEYYEETLEKMIADNLLVFSEGRLRLTKKGLPVANQVFSELV